MAYRSLQKRCHPDIAGPGGHEMAIILNEVYALLSDPNSRLAYDKEQAKAADLRGYTGKPIYSVWCGSESEERAVFVDEVKCVGCLKCALLAEKTFAIETSYGRARVVAQWADPENKIQEAIEACPVDCISMVERSNLAALEFLMSKQPRGNVRMSAGNTVGERVANIFVEVNKFQAKYRDATDKGSKERDLERETRMSAVQAIRSISNWLYWQSPYAKQPTSDPHHSLTHIPRKSTGPDINKIREAAAALKQARESNKPIRSIPSTSVYSEEYWDPSAIPAFPVTTANDTSSRPASVSSSTQGWRGRNRKDYKVRQNKQRSPMSFRIPIGSATVGAVMTWLQMGERELGGLKEHPYGSLALEIVNSSWLPVILAGTTWYIIGVAMVELLEALLSKVREVNEN